MSADQEWRRIWALIRDHIAAYIDSGGGPTAISFVLTVQ